MIVRPSAGRLDDLKRYLVQYIVQKRGNPRSPEADRG